MAFMLEGSIRRYIGHSEDRKPSIGERWDGEVLTTHDLPPGSSFLEHDTGRIWRYDGRAWTHATADARDVPTLDLLIAIHAELQAIHDLLESMALSS